MDYKKFIRFEEDNMDLGKEEKKELKVASHFAFYDELFENKTTLELRGVANHAINLRMPKALSNLLDKEIETIAKETGIRMSKNELIILTLMSGLNYSQDEEKKYHFYRKSNNARLANYLDVYKEELIKEEQSRLFQENYELVTAKYKTKASRQKERRSRQKIEDYHNSLDE